MIETWAFSCYNSGSYLVCFGWCSLTPLWQEEGHHLSTAKCGEKSSFPIWPPLIAKKGACWMGVGIPAPQLLPFTPWGEGGFMNAGQWTSRPPPTPPQLGGGCSSILMGRGGSSPPLAFSGLPPPLVESSGSCWCFPGEASLVLCPRLHLRGRMKMQGTPAVPSWGGPWPGCRGFSIPQSYRGGFQLRGEVTSLPPSWCRCLTLVLNII